MVEPITRRHTNHNRFIYIGRCNRCGVKGVILKQERGGNENNKIMLPFEVIVPEAYTIEIKFNREQSSLSLHEFYSGRRQSGNIGDWGWRWRDYCYEYSWELARITTGMI